MAGSSAPQTPTTPEEAAALEAALNAYHGPRVAAVAAFVASDEFKAVVAKLREFEASSLPASNTRQNVSNSLICLDALTQTAPQDATTFAPPPADDASPPDGGE